MTPKAIQAAAGGSADLLTSSPDVLATTAQGAVGSGGEAGAQGALLATEPTIKLCPDGLWTQELGSVDPVQCCELGAGQGAVEEGGGAESWFWVGPQYRVAGWRVGVLHDCCSWRHAPLVRLLCRSGRLKLSCSSPLFTCAWPHPHLCHPPCTVTPPGHFTSGGETKLCPSGSYRADWKPPAEAASCRSCGEGVFTDRTDVVVKWDPLTYVATEVAITTAPEDCCEWRRAATGTGVSGLGDGCHRGQLVRQVS